jgi:hypothetical protein
VPVSQPVIHVAALLGSRNHRCLKFECTRWFIIYTLGAQQVQTFLPSPMATATAMYHTRVNPLRGVRRGGSDKVEAIKGLRQRRLHKAFLRYHDPDNWPLLREALKQMGRADLVGSRPEQLVPAHQPPVPARPPARDVPCATAAGRSVLRRRVCP